jgi:predicted TIM-barrel fold metal-dependent hydrolase
VTVSSIREFVMEHELFSHHDHHASFQEFERDRAQLDHRSLLGYAVADLRNAAFGRLKPLPAQLGDEELKALWPLIRTTGYGRAVSYTASACFGIEYEPANFARLTEALRKSFEGRSAEQVYGRYLGLARNKWLLLDYMSKMSWDEALVARHPASCRFAFRADDLFDIVDSSPLDKLERFTGIEATSLERLERALDAAIDRFRATGRMAAFKIGMAYRRDLAVGDPDRAAAESAFNRMRDRKSWREGVRQNAGAVGAREGRALGDYLFHRLVQRASDERLPVQIHTGYLAGEYGALDGTQALRLVPVFDRYRSARFDVLHASWPWASELGAIAKNYGNVYPDLAWAWAMNPAASERALSEWLDAAPFTKIFGYGADTGWPWCNVGYSMQARLGIARVLEQKIQAGCFSESTAREVASAIMLGNGEGFYGLA